MVEEEREKEEDAEEVLPLVEGRRAEAAEEVAAVKKEEGVKGVA